MSRLGMLAKKLKAKAYEDQIEDFIKRRRHMMKKEDALKSDDGFVELEEGFDLDPEEFEKLINEVLPRG
jgi:hypothetical protein